MEINKFKVELISFSLREILKNITKKFKEKITEKGLVLRIINKGYSQNIIGNFRYLEKIFINLIENAIKFTQTGIITIRIDKITDCAENVTLQFSIEDSGIGIHEEVIHSIFDTQAADVGSDTGLMTCQRLINMMDGKIWLESELNKGTKVYFILTFKIDPHQANLPTSRKHVQQDIKILLVEDNLINQRLVKLILTKKGFVVYIAGNGVEAIEIIEKNNIDMVFMDIQMPEMGGNEATKIIRKNPKYFDLPIIAMTANTMTNDKEKSLEAGMNDYITKPIDTNELLRIITKWSKPYDI